MKRKMEVVISEGMRLKNAIVRDIPLGCSDMQEETKDLEMASSVMGFHLKGPLVIRRWPVMEDDGLTERAELIIQCAGDIPADLPPRTRSMPELHTGKGLYVRFIGREQDLPIVGSKMAVHAYENDLLLAGDTYTVLIDRTGDVLTADVHCPISDAE